MPLNRLTGAACVAAALFLTLCPPVPAETSQPADASSSANSTTGKSPAQKPAEAPIEIVVTATRTATPAEKTGASVTVINRKQIEDQQLHTLVDALMQVPGVAVAQSGTPGQVTGLFIRGAATEHTNVLIDGRRLPFNLAGSYNIESMTLDDVERIEVVRGPMSAVQGGSAIGGSVNIITRSGQGLDKPEASASFEGGSFGTFDETVSARGAVKGFDYSVQASRFDSDFQRNNNQTRLTNLNTHEGCRINDQLYADLLVLYNVNDSGDPNSITKPDPTGNLLRETWLLSPGLTYQTTDWWKQTLYYTHGQQRQVASDMPPAVNFFAPPPTLNYGQDNRIQTNTDQVDYQSEFQIAHNWKLTPGFSFDDIRYYRVIDVPNEFNFPVTPGGSTDIKNNFTNTAAFLQSQWEILPDWNFNSSVRLDHESDYGDYISWRVASSYRTPVTQTLLHSSYGTAFSPPSPQDIAPAFYGNTALLPELSRGFDAGVEQPFWDKRLTVSGTYFYNEINNLIIYDSNSSLQNIGQARMQGGEFGLKISPIHELDLSSTYTYTDARDLSHNVRLVRRPRHQLAFNAVGHPCEAVTLTAGGAWVVARQDGFAPAVYNIEDYFVLRFAASWKINPHVELFARMENALDEKYSEVAGFPALGRAAYGGFKLTY